MSKLVVSELDIPEQLESNTSRKLVRSFLFKNFVVSSYSGGPHFTIGNLKTKKVWTSESIISTPGLSTTYYPFVYTLSGSYLQQINVEMETVSGLSQRNFEDSNIRALISSKIYLVGVEANKFHLWTRSQITSTSKEIDITKWQEICGQVNAVSDHSTIINDTTLILINANPSSCLFQVWDIRSGELMGWGEHPGKSEGEEKGGKPMIESFLTFSFNKKRELLVGSCRGYLYIWDIRSGVKDDHMRYKYRTVVFPKCIITAILADNDFIVTGDNDGNLVLLDPDGNKIYYLNTSHTTGSKVDIESIPINQLGKAFQNRVKKIIRIGRWIIASFENGRVELYDIFTADLAKPISIHTSQDMVGGFGSTLRDLQANPSDGEVMMLYSGRKNTLTGKTQTRPVFAAWTPKLSNGEDIISKEDRAIFTASNPGEDGFIGIINGKMARVKGKISTTLERKKSEIALANLEDLDEKLFPTKIVPFYCFQKIIRNLDEVERYLWKISKSGNFSKYKKRLNERLSHHKRLVYMAKASADYIYANSRLRSSDMTPIKLCDVQSSVKVATRYEDIERELEIDTQRIEMETKDYKKPSDPVLAMLERLGMSLRMSHIELCKLINRFDRVCSTGINDPDLLVSLVTVYQLLLQMKEDLKETGKRVSETGYNQPNSWYENGGDYKEAIVPIISSK